MPYTIDSALDHDLVTLVTRRDDFGIYELRIGDLETLVTIELGKTPDDRFTKFKVSHSIHTPVQLDPYRPGRPYNDNPPAALRQAITGLTQYFEDAVRKGHTPSEEWLVEN